VDVEQVQPFCLRDVHHLGRQGDGVRGVLEERVGHCLYLMKEEVLLEGGEAEGESVANKVNLVSPLAEMDPELCGNGSASAVGGIAGDADLHMSFSFIVQGSEFRQQVARG
jgi:hypothetical protein